MTQARRTFIKSAGALATGAALVPRFALGQSEPIRLGLLTVKTGPLASGGIDMERGLVAFLRDRNNQMGGRKVDLIVADTAGTPATTRTKTQELVEKNRVHMIMGPLAAFEALAIDDYIRAQQMPIIAYAAAEDLTQRKPNPWLVRPTATSAQCAHVMADYCYKELKYRRMALVADDFAYGHEQNAGFQRVFEDLGGKIVQKLWPPLAVPDYGSYLAQLKTNIDAVYMGFAGSNGFRFLRQFNEYGLRGKLPIVGGMTVLDEAVLRNMGDEALGVATACYYSAELDNALNRKFAPAFRTEHKYDPGLYASGTHLSAAVLAAAVDSIKGNVEDKQGLMKALRGGKFDTIRGPVRFDDYGNVVADVFIRKVERKDGRLVNTVTNTYKDVSQFWTYDPKAFLASPVYSRDNPPAKNLEP